MNNTINLLPKEEKVRDLRSIMIGAALVILIILLLVVAVLSFIFYRVNSNLIPQLENYQRVNMLMANYINKLESYSEFKERVNEKAEVIAYLTDKEIIWSDILYDFGEKMPENLYIDYLEGNSEGFYKFISSAKEEETTGGQKVSFFNISGVACDYKDITKLLIQIKNMENVGEVWINSISRGYITDSNLEVLSFSISVYMDMGPIIEELGLGKTQTEQVDEQGVLEEELETMSE